MVSIRSYNTVSYILYNTILSLILFINFLSADQSNYAWTELFPPTSPSVFASASMAYDATMGKIILCGIVSGASFNQTWSFDGTTWTLLSPSSSPSKRYDASMTYDETSGKIILFGGFNDSSYLNETWSFDGTTWTLLSPSSPPSLRGSASMAYDTTMGKIILFGGYNSGGYLNDTWSFDGTTWTLLSPSSSPSARGNASMAYDEISGKIILFGGFNDSGDLNDTWSFDGTTWTQLTLTPSPSARADASMVYDATMGKIILFGGYYNGIILNDTWCFDGTTWADLTATLIPSPSARYDTSMAYDEAISKIILFGGVGNSSPLNDTWSLSILLSPLMPPSNLSGVQRKNDFGFCYELFTTLKWKASSSNISGYYVYRNGVKIDTLGSTAVQYTDHNNARNARITYSVTAFDSSGTESSPVSIIIP
jgi:hypothetical protein